MKLIVFNQLKLTCELQQHFYKQLIRGFVPHSRAQLQFLRNEKKINLTHESN
jgi:hypothetical protein